MKNIYQPFLDNIADAIGAQGRSHKPLNESISGMKNYFEKGERSFSNLTGLGDVTPSASADSGTKGIVDLARLVGLQFKTPTLGNHPDFAHISKTFMPENHYATAMFQDIKGSTSLFKKYPKEAVYVIIQTISVATTHTHALFTGHIQRLQYDGVFSYFVRKGMAEKLANFYSLCAAAFSNYFIRYELRNYFSAEHGFDSIYTKTGIDFGAKDDVMWVAYGVSGCSEVSTNSLHTSLAFKIQSHAYSDKICVGANLVRQFPELNKYFTPHVKYDGTKDNVIYEDDNKGLSYEFYDFNWQVFLLDFFGDFVFKNADGKLYIDYEYDVNTVDRVAKLRWNNIFTKIGLGAITNEGSFVQVGTSNKPQVSIPSSGFYGPKNS